MSGFAKLGRIVKSLLGITSDARRHYEDGYEKLEADDPEAAVEAFDLLDEHVDAGGDPGAGIDPEVR